MKVEALAIEELKLITPAIIRDARGFFSETYNRQALAEAGIDRAFVQDNQSLSRSKGVLRGLHFQIAPHPQGKLVRVIRGAIFDVAVDIRQGSPTFGRHASVVLSAENWSQLWIPEGFAHGFCTLEPDTEVIYKVTDFYAPECDRGLAWDDPDLGIAWPLPHAEAVLSDKDRRHPRLRDLPTHFTYRACLGQQVDTRAGARLVRALHPVRAVALARPRPSRQRLTFHPWRRALLLGKTNFVLEAFSSGRLPNEACDECLWDHATAAEGMRGLLPWLIKGVCPGSVDGERV